MIISIYSGRKIYNYRNCHYYFGNSRLTKEFVVANGLEDFFKDAETDYFEDSSDTKLNQLCDELKKVIANDDLFKLI